MASFAELSSRLIDELRAARNSAARMAELADDPREALFAEGVVARIEHLLDQLGCYD